MDSPVVIAVIVDSSLSIEEKAILASLESKSSILALEELVAEFWMVVDSKSIDVWAVWNRCMFLPLDQ